MPDDPESFQPYPALSERVTGFRPGFDLEYELYRVDLIAVFEPDEGVDD